MAKSSLMSFEIVSKTEQVEVVASGKGIHDLRRLEKQYGQGKWRKLKGIALVRLRNGGIRRAELNWYEAHGIGKKEIKRKRYLD